MTKEAGALGGQALTIAGVVVVAAGVVGAYALGLFDAKDPEPVPMPATVAQPVVPAPAVEPAPTPKDEPIPDPVVYDAPNFDVVRVEPDGSTLVAGTATAGGALDILLDGTILAQAAPGTDGKFAAFVSIAPSETPRVLSLLMRIDGQEIASEATVIIAPIVQVAEAAPQGEPVRPDTQAEPAEAAVDEISEDQPAQPGTPVAEMPEAVADAPAVPASAPKAPAVIIADKDGVTVVQPAQAEADPALDITVAIDAISYSDTGDVTVAGRGKPGQFVQSYLDNSAVGGTGIAADGKWEIVLASVAPGIYTLRVDEVNDAGNVLSRIETPFKREAPEKIAETQPTSEPAAPAQPAVKVVTVQPGSTLWAIAREKYGDGVLYVRVFEANKDRIRNPDLIYPGQVFVVPE